MAATDTNINDPLDTAQAAAFLRRSKTTLEHWRNAGKGPAYIPGKPVLYFRTDLEAWLRAQRQIPEFSEQVA